MLMTPEKRKNIVCTLIALVITAAFMIPMYFFTDWNLSDIFLIPSLLFLGYLGLRFVVRMGTFDVFAYQITNWTVSWKKGTPKKYADAYEFKNVMTEKRKDNKMTWLPFLIIGGICLILCIVFSFFPSLGR